MFLYVLTERPCFWKKPFTLSLNFRSVNDSVEAEVGPVMAASMVWPKIAGAA